MYVIVSVVVLVDLEQVAFLVLAFAASDQSISGIFYAYKHNMIATFCLFDYNTQAKAENQGIRGRNQNEGFMQHVELRAARLDRTGPHAHIFFFSKPSR